MIKIISKSVIFCLTIFTTGLIKKLRKATGGKTMSKQYTEKEILELRQQLKAKLKNPGSMILGMIDGCSDGAFLERMILNIDLPDDSE